MMKYEAIIIWETGEKEIYSYNTRDEAEKVANNFKWMFGNQVAWTGTREKFFTERSNGNV